MVRVLIAAAVAAACGCAAHHVRMEGNEGIVAIPDNSNVWPTYHRDRAVKLIEEHVGPDYEIVKQERVVSGQFTTDNQQVTHVPVADPVIPFLTRNEAVVTHTPTVHDKHEWYIFYRKRNSAPMPVAAGAVQPVSDTAPANAVVK